MSYAPGLLADIFFSYCHDDEYAWVERFKLDLEAAVFRRLRARTKLEVFLDTQDLRAGRLLDSQIPECLAETGFFIAIVSPRYNNSTYCRHKELALFLQHHPADSGRVIQAWLDKRAALPLPDAIAVEFCNAKGPYRPGMPEYDESIRRVAEPIVAELDKLYAASKMIFLAWSGDSELEKERSRLQSELEGRGLRIYPEAIAEFETEIRLRDALQESSASVHFLRTGADAFEENQLRLATQVGRPCIVASRNRSETRRGPVGSPPPVFLGQGNPTTTIANAIDGLIGRAKRDEHDPRTSLGKAGLFLVFKPDADSTLGLRVRQRVVNSGPFEILEPARNLPVKDRYDDLDRAKAAVLCWGKADSQWFHDEFDALNAAIVERQLYTVVRALYLNPVTGKPTDLVDPDLVLKSDGELDGFLGALQRASA